MLLASCFYINPCSSGTFSSSSLLISWSQVLCSLLPFFSSFLTGGTGHMSVGWEVKGERSFPKPIMYWSCFVCFQCTPGPEMESVIMWFFFFFFAMMEKEASWKRWRRLSQIWRKCNSPVPGNINCYLLQSVYMKKNQTLFSLRSLCHWIIAALLL